MEQGGYTRKGENQFALGAQQVDDVPSCIPFGTGPPSIARSRRFGARSSLGGGLHGKRRPRIGWAVRARPCSQSTRSASSSFLGERT